MTLPRPQLALLPPLFLLLNSCAITNGPTCGSTETAAISELLYFGRAMPLGEVSAEDWNGFLRDEVTPRFPDGMSVWEAAGQWRGADGNTVREKSFVLNLVHPPATGEAEVAAIMSTYQARFQQEAVLRVRSQVCASL